MKQQFSHSERIFIEYISFLVWTDVHSVNEYFSVFDPDKCFLDTAFSHTERFYLCPCKGDPCLVSIEYKIVMICFLVIRDQFSLRFCHLASPYTNSKSIVLAIVSQPVTRTFTF